MNPSNYNCLHNNIHSVSEKKYLQFLLLKDFDYFSERIRQSERMEEARIIQYFKIIFLGLIGSFLVINFKIELFVDKGIQFLIFVSLLFCIQAIGTITFLFNIKQNKATHEYKKELNRLHIRLYQNCLCPSLTFNKGEEVLHMQSKQTGQLHIIAAMNSFVAVLFCDLLLFFIFNFLELSICRVFYISFTTFISFFLFHCSYINAKLN